MFLSSKFFIRISRRIYFYKVSVDVIRLFCKIFHIFDVVSSPLMCGDFLQGLPFDIVELLFDEIPIDVREFPCEVFRFL